jgi:hypothetical protein
MTMPLSIDSKTKHFFDFRNHSPEYTKQLTLEFKRAKPFPHLVFENFLNPTADDLPGAYPAPDWPAWNKRDDFYQFGKMYCRDPNLMPPVILAMLGELSSPSFLRFLESVTGIQGIIPDPYFEGGGLHCSGPGGVLMPHTDFHYYDRLKLFRRLNLLLYLNPVWEESFGGCLELWEKGATKPAKSVVPKWGTCVIFQTDDHSVHGFSIPIGPDHWRCSIALYYYSSQETDCFSGDEFVDWQQHGPQSGMNRLRLRCSHLLKRTARNLSRIAHQANPNTKPRR